MAKVPDGAGAFAFTWAQESRLQSSVREQLLKRISEMLKREGKRIETAYGWRNGAGLASVAHLAAII